MADVIFTVSELTRVTGIVDVGADANVVAGDDGTPFYIPNDGQTLLACEGGTGATITFTSKVDEFGRDAASKTFVVGAGKFALVGPFEPALWNDGDGYVEFTLSANNADDFFVAVRLTNSVRNGV